MTSIQDPVQAPTPSTPIYCTVQNPLMPSPFHGEQHEDVDDWLTAFEDPEGPYDFVINLAAETKINLPECVYEEGILKLSRNCAKEALAHHPKRYIEISSGHMYAEGKKPAQENSSLDPWTITAQLKRAVEEDLKEMKDLDYVILRPAIVYGVADKHGIVPRILVGAVYKHLKETMKLLWTKDLKMDTVHVSDLCRAIWHVCLHGKSGDIYNVVDQGNTKYYSVAARESVATTHVFVDTAVLFLIRKNS
ncbi:hypothetical protein HPB51_014543 [Rhipicephalus microplus]|uniref:NAD-dependent epimerase/dehydratase domain-containing protein n=1 Tax=Rhipicephalus microplus TaxID=6941 RepID=A0A9J6DN18_RHIMP|nr:hypothetical protein HPB51_014543 [Rhipicephalus microplus]